VSNTTPVTVEVVNPAVDNKLLTYDCVKSVIPESLGIVSAIINKYYIIIFTNNILY
jgi:hypothetical protein